MLDDHYTIKAGRYTVINLRDRVELLKDGKPAQQGSYIVNCAMTLAMAERIEELEKAIGQVLNGSIIAGPRVRADDGMNNFQTDHPMVAIRVGEWEQRLRAVLEQKP